MKEVILKVPNKKYGFFMELVKNLGFVQIEKTVDDDSKEDILENIKQGLEELELYKSGKLKTTSAKDFLDELQS